MLPYTATILLSYFQTGLLLAGLSNTMEQKKSQVTSNKVTMGVGGLCDNSTSAGLASCHLRVKAILYTAVSTFVRSFGVHLSPSMEQTPDRPSSRIRLECSDTQSSTTQQCARILRLRFLNVHMNIGPLKTILWSISKVAPIRNDFLVIAN